MLDETKLLPGEVEAIKEVLRLSEIYGYGNLVAWIKAAWMEKLMKDGITEEIAALSTMTSNYPLSYLQLFRDLSSKIKP